MRLLVLCVVATLCVSVLGGENGGDLEKKVEGEGAGGGVVKAADDALIRVRRDTGASQQWQQMMPIESGSEGDSVARPARGAKKSAKSRSVKKAAKSRSVKKAAKSRSVKKAAKSRSVKKAAKSRSVKKAAKSRSVKKAAKSRSVKKAAKSHKQ